MSFINFQNKVNLPLKLFLLLVIFIFPLTIKAASLSVVPNTGVYQIGKLFTVSITVNTAGKSINAAEGTINFNPQHLSVVSIDKSSSIFNLWVTEPTFSNTKGTITFSGGKPSGYSGSSGNIFNVTFKTLTANSAKVSFGDGSVLANDGLGSNIISNMSGGTYTIQAVSSQPEPEVVEYIPVANTPQAPKIISSSHPDSNTWYKEDVAVLSWNLPADITEVRTLLDKTPSSIPTKVYSNPINSITLEALPEGESYFHLQFKNNNGWGKVAHYRLAVDTKPPTVFTISSPDNVDFSSPSQTLVFSTEDETSKVVKYKIKVDNDEPIEFIDNEGVGEFVLPNLTPGYHSIVAEAFDIAGNGLVSTYSFTISAFDKPVFTEYPNEINDQVIPVIKGSTRPNSQVKITVKRIGADQNEYTVQAKEDGEFVFIPESTFSKGVYELEAVAFDTTGAVSEKSNAIRIAVQEPGFVKIGNYMIDVLSVIIPLVGTLVLFIFLIWYTWLKFAHYRRKVGKESTEAIEILKREFTELQTLIDAYETELINSRRSKKLTKAEDNVIVGIKSALTSSKFRIEKELNDIDQVNK